jgi:hypothetical protein
MRKKREKGNDIEQLGGRWLIGWLVDVDPATGVAFVKLPSVTAGDDRYETECKAVVDLLVVNIVGRATWACEDFLSLATFERLDTDWRGDGTVLNRLANCGIQYRKTYM